MNSWALHGGEGQLLRGTIDNERGNGMARKEGIVFLIVVLLISIPAEGKSIYELSIEDIPAFKSENMAGGLGHGGYNNLVLWGAGAHFQISKTLPLFIGFHAEHGERTIENFDYSQVGGISLNEKIYLFVIEPTLSYEIKLPFKFNLYPGIGIGYAYCQNTTRLKIYNSVLVNGQFVFQLVGDPDIQFSKGSVWFVPKIKISRIIYKKIGLAAQLEYIKFERDLENRQITYTTPELNVGVGTESLRVTINNVIIGLNIYYEF